MQQQHTQPEAPERGQPEAQAQAQPQPQKPRLNRDATVIVVVILVIAGMLIAGRRLTRPQTPGASISGSNAALKGKPAPDFQLTDLDGNSVKLADLRGKAVLLNFWATWCPPCKIEMPWFVDLQKQYGPQGLQIVGVAMDEGNAHDAVAKFAKEMGLNYTVLLGNDKVADQYGGVDALPTTFYIGRDGKIVTRVLPGRESRRTPRTAHARSQRARPRARRTCK